MSTNNNKLAGRVAVVTGASKGIGAAIAKQLAADGASVVVNYASSKTDADRVVDQITKAGGRAVAVQGNVAKKPDIDRLFAETKKAYGKLDILVNNAGVYEFGPLTQLTEESFRRQFDVNVLGLLRTTQEALNYFPSTGGNVINISSLVSTLPIPNASVYAATKGAVDTITGVLAAELGPRKIRVNAIRPGLVETEGATSAGFTEGEFSDNYVKNAPLGRIGQPQDVAGAAAYLASDDSSWVTGQTLAVSGGR